MSALLHFLGLLLAIAALTLLIISAALKATASYTVGSVIFGSTLILLYAASTVFHFCPRNIQQKKILERIDHAMIFVLIAGTYTPICLVMQPRAWGWSIFGIVWGLAVIGATLKLTGTPIKRWISTVIYVAMGWIIVIAIQPLLNWINFQSLIWLVIGGVSYTIGAFFFSLDKEDYSKKSLRMHNIFHLLVIAGSISHFWAILELIEQVNL